MGRVKEMALNLEEMLHQADCYIDNQIKEKKLKHWSDLLED